jgi:hypothetical protein
MADHTEGNPSSDQPTNAPDLDRRTHRRLSTEGVKSLLGQVLDISPGGMRILHSGRGRFAVNDAFDVILWTGQREVPATVRVAWVQPVEPQELEVGLEFVGSGRPRQDELQALAEQGCGQLMNPQCWTAGSSRPG